MDGKRMPCYGRCDPPAAAGGAYRCPGRPAGHAAGAADVGATLDADLSQRSRAGSVFLDRAGCRAQDEEASTADRREPAEADRHAALTRRPPVFRRPATGRTRPGAVIKRLAQEIM